MGHATLSTYRQIINKISKLSHGPAGKPKVRRIKSRKTVDATLRSRKAKQKKIMMAHRRAIYDNKSTQGQRNASKAREAKMYRLPARTLRGQKNWKKRSATSKHKKEQDAYKK